jgi:hypothetical protein
MHSSQANLFGLIACIAATIPASGSAQDDPNGQSEIVVVASNKEYKATSKELKAAQTAFDKNRAKFSPSGELWFQVESIDPSESLDGLGLTVVAGDARLPVEITADHRFQIPPIERDDWRLVATRPQKLRLRAWVISPESHFGDWRLGDLALQCRVGWAIEKVSANPVLAGMFDLAGGCASSRIAIYQNLKRPIKTATISENGRSDSIPVARSSSMRFPTYFKRYSNAARVKVVFVQ